MRFFVVLMALLVTASFSALAQQATNQAGTGIPAINQGMQVLEGPGARSKLSAPGGLGVFVETIIVLALFIVAIYGVFRFVQRRRSPGESGEDAIRVLANRNVGGSRAVQVIEVGRRVFVIGVGDSAVSLIAEIEDEETLESLRLDHVRLSSGQGTGFFDRLVNMLGGAKPAVRGEVSREKLDYLRAQKERLARLKKEP